VRDEARARDAELLANYRRAILASLVDVENALTAIHNLDAAREFQNQNLAQSQLAFDGAQLRYRQGAGDFLTVLEAQRNLYAARDLYSQYQLARLQALVALCKALGGGWELQE
jgi:outer membrane protein TolC